MNRAVNTEMYQNDYVPRTRGDEPVILAQSFGLAERSPHTRG